MLTFHDAHPAEQASLRLADLYETARRIRRLGIPSVDVNPSGLELTFYDHRIGARVQLTIEPWYKGEPGWYWYAVVTVSDGFNMGALCQGRRILPSPYPRHVVRGYGEFIRYEMRLPRRKKRKRLR